MKETFKINLVLTDSYTSLLRSWNKNKKNVSPLFSPVKSYVLATYFDK